MTQYLATNTFFRLVASLTFVLFAATPSADQESDLLDVSYAEIQPLATKSLLLDIITIPGHGFVAAGERGHIVYSADGVEWMQAQHVPTRSTLTSLAFSGGRLWAAGHDTVILTSGDFGHNWTRQYFDTDRHQPILDLHFFDEHRGIAIGAYGLALITHDGGQSWSESAVNEEEWHNNGFLDLGDGRMMVAGEAGLSYRSSDDGETWESIDMPYPGSMFGIVDGVEGCVIVFGLRGNLQESCDFGDTWDELDSGTESSIAGAVLSGNMNVFVGNSGLVLTREGRGALKVFRHSSGVDFAAVVVAGEGRFLLAGEDGIHEFPEELTSGD